MGVINLRDYFILTCEIYRNEGNVYSKNAKISRNNPFKNNNSESHIVIRFCSRNPELNKDIGPITIINEEGIILEEILKRDHEIEVVGEPPNNIKDIYAQLT